jgi:hypothetical protein
LADFTTAAQPNAGFASCYRVEWLLNGLKSLAKNDGLTEASYAKYGFA